MKSKKLFRKVINGDIYETDGVNPPIKNGIPIETIPYCPSELYKVTPNKILYSFHTKQITKDEK